VTASKAADQLPLGLDELRAVTGYAVHCAETALEIFAAQHSGDVRPLAAIAAARAFAAGGARGKLLRDTAWAALKAAGDAASPAAAEAARAAMAAAGAAYLHPLPKPTQVKHILGAAAHAARAVELAAGDDPAHGIRHLEALQQAVPRVVLDVLHRYPAAPAGGGRVGVLLRQFDQALRG
jgi:hypothetical protein